MLMTKFVGKPYAGKLHVRFDEGAGTVFCLPRSTLLVIFNTEMHKEGHKDPQRANIIVCATTI